MFSSFGTIPLCDRHSPTGTDRGSAAGRMLNHELLNYYSIYH